MFCVEKCEAFKPSDIWNKEFSSYTISANIGHETHVFKNYNHADIGYDLLGISCEFIKNLDKEWDFTTEFCVNNHVIYDSEFTDYFSTIGFRLWLLRNFFKNDVGTFYSGVGIGLGTVFPRERKSCNYVGTSGIVGKIGVRLGYKKFFSWGNLSVEYMLDHFSCPLNKQNGEDKDDTGINYDIIRVIAEIPF
jgi:hypothetical protein